ncbi:hypothetical protein [Sphaerisporangium sp. TRM90804]|uniref:hypothetical protein n=1 Tax=Sphaerisporangium sp. TRM90804 TaxID=3031113 RepID=UPI002448EB26|nr:hypothetical protein [Sphaerisporangium sp. TRM90804]MDH2430116.1 hypothetical protein [Sphaerisporangium sp. TRM90804]
MCALLLLAASACSSGPTLDEAARVMAEDGAVLSRLAFIGAPVVADKSAGKDNDPTGCSEGSARRSFRITGRFNESDVLTPREKPESVAFALASQLRVLGYENDAPLSADDAPDHTVHVLRKKDPGITFRVVTQAVEPGIEVFGQTDCLP